MAFAGIVRLSALVRGLDAVRPRSIDAEDLAGNEFDFHPVLRVLRFLDTGVPARNVIDAGGGGGASPRRRPQPLVPQHTSATACSPRRCRSREAFMVQDLVFTVADAVSSALDPAATRTPHPLARKFRTRRRWRWRSWANHRCKPSTRRPTPSRRSRRCVDLIPFRVRCGCSQQRREGARSDRNVIHERDRRRARGLELAPRRYG